jgi:N,N'-diacetylchitobiose transport system permease protein
MRAQTWRPWLLLAPAFVVLGMLLVAPLGRVLQLSFLDFGLRELVRGDAPFVGLDNYRELVDDPLLWKTVLPNTVVFALVCVVLTVGIGTLVALLLFRLGPWARGVLTSAIMVAWAVPAITGTYVWVLLFDPRSGPVMRLLDHLGLADPASTNWFTERLPFYSIATLNVVHHGFPFVAITVLAGLMTLPSETLEAATIDGAGAWRRFWHITVPLLRPVFAVVTILSTIWDFKVFTQIYLMPGGNGTNREVLNLGVWSYVTALSQNRYGLGAALAVLLTVVLLLITAFYLRVMFRNEEL